MYSILLEEHAASQFEYNYSNLKPRFSASELLNIYKDESEKFFTGKSWTLFNISDKYTDEGRYNMFKKYFEETKLSQSFTELVIPVAIPAVKNETNPAMTHLFTHYDARKNSESNDTLADILMTTTAAPTIFPPYKIWNNKKKELF